MSDGNSTESVGAFLYMVQHKFVTYRQTHTDCTKIIRRFSFWINPPPCNSRDQYSAVIGKPHQENSTQQTYLETILTLECENLSILNQKYRFLEHCKCVQDVAMSNTTIGSIRQ